MVNYIQEGEVLDYTNNTGSTITAGSVVIIGKMVGVAAVNIAAGDTGAVNLDGVFELAKAPSLAITQGDQVFWDTTAKNVTKTVTDKPLGTAWVTAASNDTTIQVNIEGETSNVPVADTVAALGSTTNLPASNVTLSTSNTYTDADVKTAIDAGVNALKAAAETRLDNIEAAVDAITASLKAAGLMKP